MTIKVFTHCYSFMRKDYRALNAVFTILALYLVADEFYTYWVRKPTYSSTGQRKLSSEDFPAFLLCPEPLIDINYVKARGYRGPLGYFWGQIIDLQQIEIGWTGNKSEDVEEIFQEVSILKSTLDCLDVERSKVYYEDHEEEGSLHVEITKALYPNHMCCQVFGKPNISESVDPIGVQLVFPVDRNVESFKVYMTDRLTASYFDQHKRRMVGDEMKKIQGTMFDSL